MVQVPKSCYIGLNGLGSYPYGWGSILHKRNKTLRYNSHTSNRRAIQYPQSRPVHALLHLSNNRNSNLLNLKKIPQKRKLPNNNLGNLRSYGNRCILRTNRIFNSSNVYCNWRRRILQ